MTAEPCVVCGGRGETLTEDCYRDCGAECMVTCHVCIGTGKRPSPWGWAASLGAENSSEVGTGAKDATGGRKSNCEDCFVCLDKPGRGKWQDGYGCPDCEGSGRELSGDPIERAVLAERERCARLVERVQAGVTSPEANAACMAIGLRIRSGEL